VLIQLRIPGNRLSLLVDSGSSTSILDRESVSRLALTIVGSNPDSRASEGVGIGGLARILGTTELENASLGELVLERVGFDVMDLSSIFSQPEGGSTKVADGILGRDLLERYQAQIDFGAGTMLFRSPVKKQLRVSGRVVCGDTDAPPQVRLVERPRSEKRTFPSLVDARVSISSLIDKKPEVTTGRNGRFEFDRLWFSAPDVPLLDVIPNAGAGAQFPLYSIAAGRRQVRLLVIIPGEHCSTDRRLTVQPSHSRERD
jgi:hypothetical protein